jgi:hypothetical protein
VIHSARIRTRISRALLVALVPLTICVQGVLAHASPVSQTFRNGVTLLSFSGTFEVVWPRQVLVAGSVIELRQLRDGVNTTLLQSADGAAVETNVLCPGFSITYTCARIQLTGIPELQPGAYTMYWRVVHLDDYVEQRTVRFTVDPNWVSPSPSAVVPSPTATPTASPSAATPTPTATPTNTPAASESQSATPSASLSAVPITPSPSSPAISPSPNAPQGEKLALRVAVFIAAALFALATATLVLRRRRQR